MKKYMLALTGFAALLIGGCRKIETDGEKEIVIINGGGGGTTIGQTITLEGRINADTVLRKQNTYILKGLVYIVGNHTMTVEPGTTIKGSFSGSDVAALIITRGSKLNAQGTAVEPIIFTSASPNPQSGDWGGIVICGKASVNTSYNGTPNTIQVEGGIDNANGDGIAGGGASPDDNDNSGVLSYVRIEFAGYAFQPDKEINSLTLAAVGRGTTIDHIQIVYAKDDAIEWFGGTVNCKYLVTYKTQDDDFDTDNGYSGKVQFGIIIRDSLIADISNSEAFESDNNSGGTTATPKTSAIFSNIHNGQSWEQPVPWRYAYSPEYRHLHLQLDHHGMAPGDRSGCDHRNLHRPEHRRQHAPTAEYHHCRMWNTHALQRKRRGNDYE